jgi:hypothetical protein
MKSFTFGRKIETLSFDDDANDDDDNDDDANDDDAKSEEEDELNKK